MTVTLNRTGPIVEDARRGAKPARTIQELARHKDLTTTMRYMHLTSGAQPAGT
jgi:integrase